MLFFYCLPLFGGHCDDQKEAGGRYVRPICLYFSGIDISSRDVALKDGCPLLVAGTLWLPWPEASRRVKKIFRYIEHCMSCCAASVIDISFCGLLRNCSP